MKNLKTILTLVFLAAFSLQLLSQERTITGKVTAFKTIPLNNIKVVAKKSGKETLTDVNGRFVINCTDDDQLTFVSKGFLSQKLKVKNEKDLIEVNLFFVNNSNNIESVLSNGYIEKEKLEYALKNLPNPTKNYGKYQDIYQLIKSEFPSVQIVNNEIIVPPFSSISNSKGALIILDESYVTDISGVHPSTVISVELLKGADAGFYGLRGANGVLIIKTYVKD